MLSPESSKVLGPLRRCSCSEDARDLVQGFRQGGIRPLLGGTADDVEGDMPPASCKLGGWAADVPSRKWPPFCCCVRAFKPLRKAATRDPRKCRLDRLGEHPRRSSRLLKI